MDESLDPQRFFSSLPAFDGWSNDQRTALADLADRAEVWTFQPGDLVRFPDEASPGPTWVAEGCLAVLEAETPRYVGVREALEAPSGVWIRGQTAGRMVIVREADWNNWLQKFPSAAKALGVEVPLPLPGSLTRSPLVLEPGEHPRHRFRKSLVFPLGRAVLPFVFFLFFLGLGLTFQFGLQTSAPAWALWLLPGLGMLITGALIGLLFWEWRASMLVITDRSVLIRQIDLSARRSDFEKLSLDRIREAVYRRSGWLDAVLGLVSVELEGDSPQGRLVFRGLPKTSRFLDTMKNLQQRRSPTAPGRRLIRQALADRAGGARAPKLERAAPHSPIARRSRLSWRTEKDGQVWFRRHGWVVFQRSLPWIGWGVLTLFLGALAAGLAPKAQGTVALVTGALLLVPLGKMGWEWWDWADDRLSIEGDKIRLVHRRPLWLGETRQEGNLDQVQQVGVRKPSLAALLLDFGVVTVNLGTSEPLVFEAAAHPDWVQNEIFHRRTLLAQDREQRDSRRRLDEVSEILDTWDEARTAGYFDEEKKEPS